MLLLLVSPLSDPCAAPCGLTTCGEIKTINSLKYNVSCDQFNSTFGCQCDGCCGTPFEATSAPAAEANWTAPGRELLFYTGPRAAGGADLDVPELKMRTTYGTYSGAGDGTTYGTHSNSAWQPYGSAAYGGQYQWFASIGTGSCRNGANNRYPPYGQRPYDHRVVNGAKEVEQVCMRDQYCLGYWCAAPPLHPTPDRHPRDGMTPARRDAAGCTLRVCIRVRTRSSARGEP